MHALLTTATAMETINSLVDRIIKSGECTDEQFHQLHALSEKWKSPLRNIWDDFRRIQCIHQLWLLKNGREPAEWEANYDFDHLSAIELIHGEKVLFRSYCEFFEEDFDRNLSRVKFSRGHTASVVYLTNYRIINFRGIILQRNRVIELPHIDMCSATEFVLEGEMSYGANVLEHGQHLGRSLLLFDFRGDAISEVDVRFRETFLALMEFLRVHMAKWQPGIRTDPKIDVFQARSGGQPRDPHSEFIHELNDLVGLETVKKHVQTLINMIILNRERRIRNIPSIEQSLHMVFLGSAGTGKTTVARILGGVMRDLGIIKKGHVVEVDRAGLVAGYVGQTALKVDQVFKEALDGILFIDEAYSLAPPFSSSDFGNEAIDAIVKRMEDLRDRVVVIVAGYTDEMNRFLETNPGLKSRFPNIFVFEDYSPAQLLEIFANMCNNAHLHLTDDAREKAHELFNNHHRLRDRSFGNGRLVRNVFEKCLSGQANRLAFRVGLTEVDLTTIISEDIPSI